MNEWSTMSYYIQYSHIYIYVIYRPPIIMLLTQNNMRLLTLTQSSMHNGLLTYNPPHVCI